MTAEDPAVSLEVLGALAEDIYAGLPEEFRSLTEGVHLMAAEHADRETLSAMGVRDPLALLGLYHGTPLAQRLSGTHQITWPSRIYLYRQPILRYARHHGHSVEAVIRHVLIHEIGHHFGLSDAAMAAIEATEQ